MSKKEEYKHCLFFMIIIISINKLYCSHAIETHFKDSQTNELHINNTKTENEILLTKLDHCDMEQSRIAVFIIEEIRQYINNINQGKIKSINNKDKRCLIMDDNLINYISFYDDLEEHNKNFYSYFKCNKCEKVFKNKEFLYLHFNLFHLKKNEFAKNQGKIFYKNRNSINHEPQNFFNFLESEGDNYICPADLCIFLNCNRYKNFLNIEKSDKKIFKYPEIECNPLLENLYKQVCMKLVENCFFEDKDKLNSHSDSIIAKSKNEYYNFYKIFCEIDRCDKTNFNSDEIYLHEENILFDNIIDNDNQTIKKTDKKRIKHISLFGEIPKDDVLLSFLYRIFLYLIGVFTFIYILILWITKLT